MKQEQSSERLDYLSGERQKPEEHYTERPIQHRILAWILLGVVIFAIAGMCYWQMFGKF